MTEGLFGEGFGLLAKGGAVMYVLLALSIVALAIIFLKLFQYRQLRLRRTGFVNDVIAKVAAGQTKEARAILSGQVNPVARVVDCAIETAARPGLEDKATSRPSTSRTQRPDT